MKHDLEIGLDGADRMAWCTCGEQCPEKPAIVSRAYIWFEGHVAEVQRRRRRR